MTDQALAVSEADLEETRAAFLAVASPTERDAFESAAPEKQTAILSALHLKNVEVAKRIAPAGGLNLPRLLDERRREYGIVNRAFTHHRAVFDCVLVYQIDQFGTGTYGGGAIAMSESAKRAETLESARCIIVSAGQKALDELRSHGIDLGHIVHVCKHTPLRQRVDMVNGKPEYLLMIRPGDITDSEDLAQGFVNGDVALEAVDDPRTGAKVHLLKIRDAETGEYSPPIRALMPWISEDS